MMTEADLPGGATSVLLGYCLIKWDYVCACACACVCKRFSFSGSALGFSCVCHPKRSSPKDRPQPQHLSRLQ